jgi:hypothetical protein
MTNATQEHGEPSQDMMHKQSELPDLGPSGLDLEQSEEKRTRDPHANDEYYRAEELVEKARETKLRALALALHAGLIEAAGLTDDLAEARRNGLKLPAISSSETPATLDTIQALNQQAEDLFGEGQAIRMEISRNAPKSAEEALERDKTKYDLAA